MVDARENTSSWLLRGSILAAVEQVLSRLNLEDRARMHRHWKEAQTRRPLAQLPPIIQGVLPHPDRPYPRGLTPSREWRWPSDDLSHRHVTRGPQPRTPVAVRAPPRWARGHVGQLGRAPSS